MATIPPEVVGLVGILVGASIPLATTWITQRGQRALEERKIREARVGLACCTCLDFSSSNLRRKQRASSSRALVRSIIFCPSSAGTLMLKSLARTNARRSRDTRWPGGGTGPAECVRVARRFRHSSSLRSTVLRRCEPARSGVRSN